jgi:hypothetical protein
MGSHGLPSYLKTLLDHVPDAHVIEILARRRTQGVDHDVGDFEQHDLIVCSAARNKLAVDDTPRKRVHGFCATHAFGADEPEGHKLVDCTEGYSGGFAVSGVRLYHIYERPKVGHDVKLLQVVYVRQFSEKSLERLQVFVVDPLLLWILRILLRQSQCVEQVMDLILHALRREFCSCHEPLHL